MTADLPFLILSYVYLFGTLAAAEGLRRWQGYPVDFTRKVVHIAAGMTVWLLLLFRHLPMALIPPISFIFINALSYWKGTFQAMETGERGNLGTVYFPLSFSILTWLLWNQRPLLVAALMPMTWGDALAAVVGRRWGRRRFRVPGSTRSLEGSLTFLAVAWMATAIPLALLPATPFPGWNGLIVALGVAAATAAVEALSPWGLDNLTVPAVSALVLWAAHSL
ncbi:MAG TPA: phosphatidate cytidylyltransferase [Anaerolineales bacterium]|nr:phosphatidate cytidylyltransferase [Anaerolineae bacterium]HIQ02715.1 phosphatidate cytidylyltransferase [Anaerolineales bacterium]